MRIPFFRNTSSFLPLALGLALLFIVWTAVATPPAAAAQHDPLPASPPEGMQGGNLLMPPPVAGNDVYTVTEDTALTITMPGVLGNDTDPDGNILQAALSGLPSHGAVVLNSDGSFVYTPTANYDGTDTFAYLAYDGLPLSTIAYWPFDDQTDPTTDASGNGHDGDLINGPVFSTDVPITYTGSTASLQFDGVDDRVDAAGNIPLANNSFTVAFWAKRSSLSGNSDFAVGLGTSTTTNNYLHIGFRNSNIFTCAFWNNDLNTSSAYTDLDWHHWACTYDVDTNFRAIYRDGVMVASDTASANFQGTGTLTVGSRGTGDHFAGSLDEVRIYDQPLPISEIANIMTTPPGIGAGDTASVIVNITPVNDPPIAVDDTYTTTQETPLTSPLIEDDLTTMFASNNGQDGNMFNITAGPQEIHITGFDLNVDTPGSQQIAVYYKAGTYAGSEQNPNAWTLLGTFMVDAQGNNNPTWLDITSAGGITIPAGEIYGLYLSVTNTSISFRYTNGTNTYSNAHLTFSSGTGNPYPFGNPIGSRIWNGTIYYEINNGVLANDSDVDSFSLTANLDNSPSFGTLSLNSNGTFVYTPTLNYCGLDTFTYYANDGITNSNLATANISISCGPNDPPVTGDDAYTTTEDIPLTIAAPGVLSNDTDPNGDELSATLLMPPANGAITLNSDGSFDYTPNPNFNGVDTFTYSAADSLPSVQGYWPFEDGSNPTADESDQNHPGTLVNGTTFVSSTPVTLTNSTQVLSFDGVDDRVDITGLSLANESFTVAFWAKRNAISGNYDIVIGQGTGSTNTVLHIGFRDTNIFTCAFWNNDLNTAATYTDLNWHHWACTYDATTNQRAIYRDGTMVASDVATADFQGSGTFGIGHRNNGDHYNGLVDDVRIYNGALSAAEIQAGMVGYMPGLMDTAVVTLTVSPVNDPPVAEDDAYTTAQGTPFNANSISNSLTTLFAQNNGQSGNMFDVTAGPSDIYITSFDANIDAGAETVEVYYKLGSYVGSEQAPGAWTLLGTANVVGLGSNIPTPVPIGGLAIPAGQTVGIYFTLSTGTQINYTNGANFYSNGDLSITTGTGNGYPFGTVNNPRTWNGTIYYMGGGVLSNDSDVEGSTLTASLSTSPGNGTLTLNTDGSFSYTPTVSFVGVDTFDYIASDGTLTDTATVSITVTALPCMVEATGDNLTDYASADESALQNAVNNANSGDLLKVAGTCAGVHLQGGGTQTVYISQTLTIQGGYTYTNWLATPDPIAHPTVLNAQGAGRVVYIPAGHQVILNSLAVTAGSIAGEGGGIYSAGELHIQQTAVYTNTATSFGGGIRSTGSLTITNSTLAENTADSGSGIHNTGSLAVQEVTFTENESTGNGTIANFGNASIQTSTFYSNTAVRGGGVYADGSSTLLVANSTFAHNSTAEGGGIHNRGAMTVTNSTFAYNTANVGAGIHNWGGNLSLYNDIIAHNNMGAQCHNSGGTVIASINNLISDGTCGASLTADPSLAPLADNGGSTWTFMLQEGSPAIDAGDDATCETSDQRGIARPEGLHCDMGAVEAEQELLSVSVTGTGSVSSNPPGIACGITCTASFYPNSVVTLTASAATGSTFIGWSGDCTGTGDCVITMDIAHNVTATFTLDQHDLTVALAGTGGGSVSSSPAGISCQPDCTETYDYGTAVTLTAAADIGSTFIGWSGDCSGTGDCVVTMDIAHNVTATFTRDQHELTVALAGTGGGSVNSSPAGINCQPDCAETYDYGTVVTLTAAADIGSTFTGWTGDCTGTGDCVVTMDAMKNVTATFTLGTNALTVARGGTGSGTVASDPAGIECGVTCVAVFDYGTVVTLTAVTNPGSTFGGWSGACAGTGNCVVTMDAAQNVTATFTLDQYELNVTVDGNGGGTVTSDPTGIDCGADCAESFDHGTVVTLTAVADANATFTGWSGACSGLGACVVTMDMAQSVTATFIQNEETGFFIFLPMVIKP